MTGALQRRTDKMRNGPETVFVQHRGRDEYILYGFSDTLGGI